MDERVRQSDQAFWDAAACAALSATAPPEFVAMRAARCADALLEERRKRQAARDGARFVRCVLCGRDEERDKIADWTRTPLGVEGLTCPACAARPRSP